MNEYKRIVSMNGPTTILEDLYPLSTGLTKKQDETIEKHPESLILFLNEMDSLFLEVETEVPLILF